MDEAESSGLPDEPGATPAPPPGGWPFPFDPSRDLMLTPRRLRGLVHPIRVRLLTLLETDGPATASQLGRRIGQSSGVTSYHLRMLADLGFVEDDTARGNGRDRWWRTTYRSSAFSFRSPDDPGDPETAEVAEQYMRIVIGTYYERMLSYVNSLAGRLDELPTLPWTFAEKAIELTHDEARALAAEVHTLIDRYRRAPGTVGRRPGTHRATFQFQMLPDDLPSEEDPS
ncbi:helix-turn-helix domain-containing protein [Planosporangium sp. 12N6]|uniref:helix-turn-helix domain-containing protein n=1 Tax=Planosporangium spinosum TaxID=3402278 RepID=UPI003CEBE0B6